MIYIITGTSSGLGYELTKKLLRKNKVIGVARQEISKNKFSENELKNYSHFKIDLSLEFSKIKPAILKLFDFIPDYEEFTLVMNAAKFTISEEILNINESMDLYNCNFFNITQIVKEASSIPNFRRVLFINSISGLIAQSSQYDYSASKHALQAFSDSLSLFAKEKKFDVMTINPGGMQTELWNKVDNGPDTSDFLDPEEVSDIIASLLELKGRFFIKKFVLLPPSDL